MAMRMMRLRNVMGASTYQYHTEQTIKTLKATARGLTPFRITEPGKLKGFAARLGIDEAGSEQAAALLEMAIGNFKGRRATIDAVFALAFGLYTYVNPVPTVTGGPNLVALLTDKCKDITGGLLNVERDAVKAADAILAHIEGRRKKLGI